MPDAEMCKYGCGVKVLFAQDHRGRRMPLDLDPEGPFKLVSSQVGFLPVATAVPLDVAQPRYRRHKCRR